MGQPCAWIRSSTVPAAHLELSGAIDILWQLKDPRGSDEVHLDIHEESKRFMSDFFDRVRACKDSMLPIRESINTIKQLHAKIITEVSQTKSKEYSKKLDALLSETSRKARDVKDQLKALEVENAVYEEKFGRNSAEFKIHLNMHGTVTKKFIELMHEYETTQGKYKSLLKERVARQVKVANPNATEQEVAEAVENGGANVFVDQVLSKADQVASKHERKRSFVISSEAMGAVHRVVVRGFEGMTRLAESIAGCEEAAHELMSSERVDADLALEHQLLHVA